MAPPLAAPALAGVLAGCLLAGCGEAAPPAMAATPVPARASATASAGWDSQPPVPGDTAGLRARALAMPVAGVQAAQLQDTFGDPRSQGAHEALDIAAPRGTAVHAVDDGVVAKLFLSERGGITVYQFDPASRHAYYYAHLDRYAKGLHEGQRLRRCDVLGYVGVSGNAPPGAPHLHFAIFRLEAEPRWWRGTAVNPYPLLRPAGAPPSQPCPATVAGGG